MLGKLLSRASGVAIGTAAGQGLILACTPYLARRHSPEDFGLLALLMTASNVSLAAACLRYDLAIPSAARRDARPLLAIAFGWAVISGLVALLLIHLVAGQCWAQSAGVLLLHPAMLGVCVVIVGWYQATAAWFLHQGAFTGLAWLRFSQGAGFSALALIPGLGLGWAHVLSFFGGLIGAGPMLSRAKDAHATLKDVSYRHRQFPLLSLPGAFLDVCGFSLCIWVIDIHYGHGTAGNFSQLQRLTGAPLMLLSISLGQVLLKQTAELAGDIPALRAFLLRLLALLVAVATVGMATVFLIGEPVLKWVLGPQWEVDRNYVTLVAIAVFVRACVSPLSTVLVTLKRFKRGFVWQACYFTSAALLMPTVAKRLPFREYLAFYAAHEVVFYCFYLFLIFGTMPRREHACDAELKRAD